MADAQKTKDCIREALVELMLEMHFEKITAVDLARKANVSRATLYRYFGSVEEVLEDLESHHLEGMRDTSRYYISEPLDFGNLDKPFAPVVAIADYVKQHKSFFLAMTGPYGDGRFVHKWHMVIKEFYLGKLAFEGFRKKDADFYIEFVMAGSDAVLRYWLQERPDVTSEDIAPIIQNILYGPFLR